MEETSTSQKLERNEQKRKLLDVSPVQAAKKRKKIKIVRKDDDLVNEVLADQKTPEVSTLSPKTDKRFRLICFDCMENIDDSVESVGRLSAFFCDAS